jgi:hypothetical protein
MPLWAVFDVLSLPRSGGGGVSDVGLALLGWRLIHNGVW